jgi:predicted transcriptional regulator
VLGEGTVYDVQAQFPARRRPKYTTLLTVLRTLEQKGLAVHRTQERTYVFRPAVEQQELRRSVLRDVLGRVFAGSPKDLVAALLDVDEVTPEVLAEMKAMIAAREGVTSDE